MKSESLIFTLQSGEKLNVTAYKEIAKGYDVVLKDGANKKLTFSEVKFIDPDFEQSNESINTVCTKSKKVRVSNLDTFYFRVATWTRSGNIKTKTVSQKAKDEDTAFERVEKRFPNAYDISI
jgi:hypothetical protein